MRRYIARIDTEEMTLDEIISILEGDEIKIEKYMKYIDVYVLLSKKKIPDYPFISDVQAVDYDFEANELDD